MAKKKKLRVNGSELIDFDISIKTKKSEISHSMVEFIFLRVKTGDDVFKYEIGSNPTHPDLNFTKNYISNSLAAAMSDYSNVEITEDLPGNRLHYEVQGLSINTYPGRRI